MKSQSPVSVHSSLSGWLAGFCFISWVTLLSVGCATPHPIDSPKFDTDGMVFTGNQRSFILGLYQPTNGTGSFRELSETGYNLLNLPADTRLLDSAQKYGLKAWVTTGTLDTLKLEKSWKSIQKVVLSLKNHPALLAWEIADEPAYTWNSSQLRIVPKLMIATHDSISTLDPTHLIYLNHAPVNLVQTMQQYNRSNDLTACDIYPIIPLGIRPMYALNPDGRQGDLSNTTPSQVGDYVDKMRKVSGDHRPLCMVLQGFAWEMLRAPAERDSTKILYPDYKSSWFMAWDAIIHGVNGLIWWGTAYTPAGHLFHKELKQVVQRLSSLSPALSLPAKNRPFHVEYDEPGHSVDKGVELLIKEDDLNLWLFTANREYYPLKADIRIGLPPATANVLYEGRTIQISAEGFSDSFGPYEVHLYHLTKKH